MNSDYAPIARYYDAMHAGMTADIPFIVELIGREQKMILELGCGTGRLVFPLAKAGHRVIGLDLSEAMLAIAMDKLSKAYVDIKEKVVLLKGDMTRFHLSDHFDWVLYSHNTAHILTQKELIESLSCVARHLKPSGIVLIDLSNPFHIPDFDSDEQVEERRFIDQQTGRLVVQSSRFVVHSLEQLYSVEWIFEEPLHSNSSQRVVSYQVDYHFLYPHQVDLIVSSAGLRIKRFYGGYDFEPFDEESERMVVEARLINGRRTN